MYLSCVVLSPSLCTGILEHDVCQELKNIPKISNSCINLQNMQWLEFLVKNVVIET